MALRDQRSGKPVTLELSPRLRDDYVFAAQTRGFHQLHVVAFGPGAEAIAL